jgi:hypothetical protein
MQLQWSGQNGKEDVWKCQATWSREPVLYEYYTQSEFDWMLVEVNLRWRMKARKQTDAKRATIPFYCKWCKSQFKDKNELGYHRVHKWCTSYDYERLGRLKMFPVCPPKLTQQVVRDVFKRYDVQLPRACGGQFEYEDDDESKDDEEGGDEEDTNAELAPACGLKSSVIDFFGDPNETWVVLFML